MLLLKRSLADTRRAAAGAAVSGRRRWLDVMWEKARLIAEIDGAGHADILQYWDDMDRDNA
jgi:hypothetical protein